MSDSTRKTRRRKSATDRPRKPYPDFPLSPHPGGAWQKRIRGHLYYFGRWANRVNGKLERLEGDGWEQALALYKAQADDLHAGRKPRSVTQEGLTLADLCNRFLTAKVRRVEGSELSPRSLYEYRQATDQVITFGTTRLVDDIAGDDFETLRATMAKRWEPARLGKFIGLIRAVFSDPRWGHASAPRAAPSMNGRTTALGAPMRSQNKNGRSEISIS